MTERTVVVQNGLGIHCRPSAVIIKAVHGCPCRFRVTADSGEADLTSLMALLSLGLDAGATVRIRASGPDEQLWCDRVAELFETHFDFPPRS